jgi:hypothetical protein
MAPETFDLENQVVTDRVVSGLRMVCSEDDKCMNGASLGKIAFMCALLVSWERSPEEARLRFSLPCAAMPFPGAILGLIMG